MNRYLARVHYARDGRAETWEASIEARCITDAFAAARRRFESELPGIRLHRISVEPH